MEWLDWSMMTWLEGMPLHFCLSYNVFVFVACVCMGSFLFFFNVSFFANRCPLNIIQLLFSCFLLFVVCGTSYFKWIVPLLDSWFVGFNVHFEYHRLQDPKISWPAAICLVFWSLFGSDWQKGIIDVFYFYVFFRTWSRLTIFPVPENTHKQTQQKLKNLSKNAKKTTWTPLRSPEKF